MRVTLLAFALLLSFVGADAVVPVSAHAAYSAKGKCRSLQKRMYAKQGYGAFAVSRNGRACGLATGYPGPKAAARAARRQCRKLSRGCRVVRTKKGARRTSSKKSPRLRSTCKSSFRTWKSKRDGYSAFALAKDGSYCNAVWNGNTAKAARQAALKGCKAKVGCTIFAQNSPKDLDQVRQQQLADLGFYKGKIDGVWGRGTRSAMKRFVTQAKHDDQNDDKAWELLKWATQIKRSYTVENAEAIKLAQQAYIKGNILFVAALAKPRTKPRFTETNSAPNVAPDATPNTSPVATSAPKLQSTTVENDGTATAKRDARGQFTFMTELDALPVRMLFDTGASYVAISETTARKIGIILKPSDFKHLVNTANGQTKSAKAKVKEMRVGNIVLEDVEISVLRDASLTSGALLGMSFVKRLKRFEFEGESIKLTQ